MTTPEIAKRLVELCRIGKDLDAQKELYADDAVSIEPDFAPRAVTKGREGLAGKVKWWHETFEVHSGTVGDPIVAGPFFSCTMSMDVTEKKSGKRIKMAEIAVFETRDGKIVREQFFYPEN